MPFPRFALLAGLVLLAASAHAQTPDYVTLAYTHGAGEVVVTLNGFPVVHDASETGAAGGLPVNLHLVPTGNRLAIDFRPTNPGSDLSLSLSADAAGDIVETDQMGDLIMIELAGADGAQRVEETFDLPAVWAEAFTVGQRYAALPAFEDEAALRAYAVALQRAFAAAEAEALAEHLYPAITDRYAADPARVASYPLDEFVRLSVAELPRLMAGARPLAEIAGEALVLTPWADGRLWQITRPSGEALIVIERDDGAISIPIFVGEVEGALRVVR